MWGRALEGQSRRTDLVISLTAGIQHWRVPCDFGVEKESGVGHFDKALRITQKKTQTCVRTKCQSIKYLNLLAPELFFFNFSTHCI